MNEVTKHTRLELSASRGQWLSLAITIHFFAIAVSLASNREPSQLQRRIQRILAAYAVGFHQDYGAVPLEMTRGDQIDAALRIQLHDPTRADDPWIAIGPERPPLAWIDRRWSEWQRMLAIAVSQQNEEVIHLIYSHALARHLAQGGRPVDGIRLSRSRSLAYEVDQAIIQGELPESERRDENLFACKVVQLPDGRLRLIPEVDRARAAKSLLAGDAERESNK